MRITIKDIALKCGVSVGTVDRALNGRPGINEETKLKIIQTAEQMQYRPNYMGQSLARGKTLTIGVICFDLRNNFFPELIEQIEGKAKEKGYFLQLILTHMDYGQEKKALQYLCDRHVDGILLFPVGLSAEYVTYLKNLQIPIVSIYNRLDDNIPFIGVNDRAAFAEAVHHIHHKGYEQILYIAPDMVSQEKQGLNTYTLRQRLNGYLDGMKECGLEEQCRFLTEESIEKRIDLLIREKAFKKKTAILCLCDSYAIRVLNCLRERGLRVPEDVGLMGYDDISQLDYIVPRLATFRYSVARMGDEALRLLFLSMEGELDEKECLLDYELIEGESL